MTETPLYPLRFDPIYQYRPWGGRRLSHLLCAPLPNDGPIGEAWLLSDRDEYPSRVAEGALKGHTLRQLLEKFPHPLLGRLTGHAARFPLLLKFLDVRQKLSVQVHPSDANQELIPPGDTGKTEAWVVLEGGPEARVYAGLKSTISATVLRQAVADRTVAEQLASFTPKPGDAVLIPAGAIHSLSDSLVFEVQQNSDVTFRLYDWDRVDPATGQKRPLQVDQAMACIDFQQGAIGPVTALVEQTELVLREKLVHCAQFGMTRVETDVPFIVGAHGIPRVLVCLRGQAQVENAEGNYAFAKGDVLLLPAEVGACSCRPRGVINLLEISLPDAV